MLPHKPGQSGKKIQVNKVGAVLNGKPRPAKKPAPAFQATRAKAERQKAQAAAKKPARAAQGDQFTGTRGPVRGETAKVTERRFQISATALARAKGNQRESLKLARKVFAAAEPMKGVVPEGKATIAMDSQIELATGWAAQSIYNGAFSQGVVFMGYPYLAELAQRAEYRRISEVIASEMTRKWIEIKTHSKPAAQERAPGDDVLEGQDLDALTGKQPAVPAVAGQDPKKAAPAIDALPATVNQEPGANAAPQLAGPDGQPMPGAVAPAEEKPDALALLAKKLQADAAAEKDERVKALEDEFKRLNVQDAFKELAEQDGFFGRSHLYIGLKNAAGQEVIDDRAELITPIGTGNDAITQAKVGVGMLERIKTVEAVWCYPSNYNSFDPLSVNWYKPSMWFVMGKEIHASRLLTFVGREVPDMLKPAYSFGGLSLSQMAQPCVQNWLRTRQSVSDIVHAFSVFVLKTNMATSVQEDGEQVFARADFFNAVRDNRGLMMIDKNEEEFENVSAPLSSLPELQSQSQEHICSVSGIPVVKYTGITPSGLNASSDGEIRVFYDWIHAYQQMFFTPNLTRVFHLAQMNLWGKVDPDLYFEYVKLHELTELEEADLRNKEADTDTKLVGAQILQPEESRERLSNDTKGPYAGIDVNNVPEPEQGADPFGQREGFEGDDDEDEEGGAPDPDQPDGAVAQPEA